MANHASALKRARQNEKRNIRNRAVKTRIKSQIRKLNDAIEAGNKEQAETEFRLAQKYLAKAGSAPTLHTRNASRRIGRLAKRVQAL